MSMDTCDRCGAAVDTDEDVDCYPPNDECVCVKCRDQQEDEK